MKHSLSGKYLPESKSANPWRYEEKWLGMIVSVWKRLDQQRQEALEQKIKTYARSRLAYQILLALKHLAERMISSDVQAVIKVIITVAGGFTYGAGMRVITSGLGIFALPAGLLGGAIASFIVDRLAVAANTNRLKKEQVIRRLQILYQQLQEAKNQAEPRPLQILFYETQIKLVQEIEGEALQKSFPTKAVWAVGLSLIEYAVALWIVQNVALLAIIPLPIRMVVAALPVVLTHAAALAQALAFEMPRYARELMPLYRNELVPEPNLSAVEIQRWQLFQEFENGQLDAWMGNLFDRHPMEPNPPLARLAFAREFIEEGIQQLHAQAQSAERDRWEAYERDVAALPSQFPAPMVDEAGRTELEIARIKRDIDRQREHWIKVRTEELKQQAEQDVERLRDDYNGTISVWQLELSQVKRRYDIHHQRWEVSEQHRGDDGLADDYDGAA